MAHTLQERYSSLVLAKLRKESIFLALFNNKYEGTPTAGAVKIPVRDGEVAIGSYNTQTGKALTFGSTTYMTLPIDKDYAVNELIDGYEASAVPDNLVADRLDSAGYTIANQIDNDLVALLLDTQDGGTVLSDTTALAKSTVYDKVIDAIQSLKKLGLKTNEMWLAVTNEIYGLMLKCPEFIKASDLGDAVVQNGLVGKIGGVNVYETNNIDDTTKVEFILGNNVFCHYVDEWKVPVAINDLKDGAHIGASAVQGRIVAGDLLSRKITVLIKKHA